MFEFVGDFFGSTPETTMANATASLVFVTACLVVVGLVIGILQLIYIKRGIDAMNESGRQRAADRERQSQVLQKLIEESAKSREAADKRSEQQIHALEKLIEESAKDRKAADKRIEQQNHALQQQGLALQKLIEDSERNREDGEKSREALAEAVTGLRLANRDAALRQQASAPGSA